MIITADLKKGILIANGGKFSITCNVRTLKDGTRGRAAKEVRRCIPDNLPYDPMQFPRGMWNILAVEWRKDFQFDEREFGDVKIRTDAWQEVKVWELDKDGNYLKATNNFVKDSGYLLHYSESLTTLGCIRVAIKTEMNTLAKFIQEQLKKEKIQIEVL